MLYYSENSVSYGYINKKHEEVLQCLSLKNGQVCIVDYQDLNGIGMANRLTLPSVIALASCALGKPTISSLAVLGEISISGTILKVEELASVLQTCLDAGARKVLIPITSANDIGLVPADLIGAFSLIFYNTPQEAVYKALGVE